MERGEYTEGAGIDLEVHRGEVLTIIGPSGGNQPHENMQPSIALLYCEKSR